MADRKLYPLCLNTILLCPKNDVFSINQQEKAGRFRGRNQALHFSCRSVLLRSQEQNESVPATRENSVNVSFPSFCRLLSLQAAGHRSGWRGVRHRLGVHQSLCQKPASCHPSWVICLSPSKVSSHSFLPHCSCIASLGNG